MGTESGSNTAAAQATLVEESDIQHTGSKKNGNDAEAWVRDHYDLDPQDSDICPEYAHDAVDPRTGTPIEIKSCQIRYNGTGSRGRFQIWDYAHETLLEHGGGYIFVVHEPKTNQFHVYLHRPLDAAVVDERIGNWHPIDHKLRPDEAHRTSVGQSAVFTDIQITRLSPEEIEERNEQAAEEAPDADAEPGEDPEERIPQVERVKVTKEIIEEIEEQHEDDLAPHAAVIARLQAKGLDESTADHHIEELKKKGEIYQPEADSYRVT